MPDGLGLAEDTTGDLSGAGTNLYGGGGLGLAPPEQPPAQAAPQPMATDQTAFNPTVDAPTAAPRPASDPYAAIRNQIDFKENPVGAIGLMLSSVAAGMQGKPSPLIAMTEQAQNRQLLEMKQLDLGLQASDHGVKIISQLPADKRDAAAEKYGAAFEKAIPGFTDTLKSLVASPDSSKLLDSMTNLGPQGRAMIMGLSNNNSAKMLEILKDKDLMSMVQGADDRALAPSIAGKVTTIGKIIMASPAATADVKNGNAPLTFANFQQWNSEMAKKNPDLALSPQEMDTLGRNEGMQTQLGITPASVSLKGSQSAAEAMAKLPSEKEKAAYQGAIDLANAGPKAQAEAAAKLPSEKEKLAFQAGLELQTAGPKAAATAAATPTPLVKNLTAAGLEPGTPDFNKAMLSSLLKPTTNIDMKGESAFSTSYGKSMGEQAAAIHTAADSARNQVAKLGQLEGLMKNVDTGKLTPGRSTVAAWADSLGLDEPTLASVGLKKSDAVNAQAITSLANGMTMSMIGAGGFPANNFSDADRKFLSEVMPNLSNTAGGNKIITQGLKAVANRTIDKEQAWLDAQDKGQTYPQFLKGWTAYVNKTPLFPKIAGDDDFTNLKSGTIFVAPDDSVRVKP